MNPIEHVQFVNVCRCPHPDCHGDEHGCKISEQVCKGMPRWEKWTHDAFAQKFLRCPPGCQQKHTSKVPLSPPPGSARSIPDESLHLCHARGCGKPVPPRLLMCLRHWRMVPIDIQRQVWKHYRPGQEMDKRPSAEYLEVMKEAILAVAKREGLA